MGSDPKVGGTHRRVLAPQPLKRRESIRELRIVREQAVSDFEELAKKVESDHPPANKEEA